MKRLVGAIAVLCLLATSAVAFWQSRDSNYNHTIGGGATPTCSAGWTGPTTGLTHCWMLDNAHVSGTTILDSVGSINGTAGANVTAGTGPSGGANTARTYDGLTQAILLASDPIPGSQPLTVATWVNETTGQGNDGDPRMLCFQGAGSIEAIIANQNVSPPNYIDIAMASFGAAETSSSTGFSSSAWHHVAVTYDGVSLLLYLDGSLLSTPNPGVADGCDANTWALGGRNSANRLWAGSQATTVIYNRALSSGEITTLFNAF